MSRYIVQDGVLCTSNEYLVLQLHIERAARHTNKHTLAFPVHPFSYYLLLEARRGRHCWELGWGEESINVDVSDVSKIYAQTPSPSPVEHKQDQSGGGGWKKKLEVILETSKRRRVWQVNAT